MTVEDLLKFPDYDRYELVCGELREDVVSFVSEWIGGKILSKFDRFLDDEPLGYVIGSNQLFHIWPDKPNLARKPNVAFIPRERVPGGPGDEAVVTAVPALVVEVSSPSNEADDLFRKVMEYLEAGVSLVWVIYPPTRMAQVFRADRSTALLDEEADLDGEDVLPGFRCKLARVLPEKTPAPAQS